MLSLRPCCEQCAAPLPPASELAYICSYECTFCKPCALKLFGNVCPNCGGGFVPRPVRPKEGLTRFPPSTTEIIKKADMENHAVLLLRYKDVPPAER